jgi:hypothetical protein
VRVGPQNVQIAHIRELIGEVTMHLDPDSTVIGGFTCRRYRVCNDSPHIVIAAEAFCTTVESVRQTALPEERKMEAVLHPLALPLAPDELVVESTTRSYANNDQHIQTYALVSVKETIDRDDIRRIEAYLGFPVEADGAP